MAGVRKSLRKDVPQTLPCEGMEDYDKRYGQAYLQQVYQSQLKRTERKGELSRV